MKRSTEFTKLQNANTIEEMVDALHEESDKLDRQTEVHNQKIEEMLSRLRESK